MRASALTQKQREMLEIVLSGHLLVLSPRGHFVVSAQLSYSSS